MVRHSIAATACCLVLQLGFSYACSWEPLGQTLEEEFDNIDVIFYGFAKSAVLLDEPENPLSFRIANGSASYVVERAVKGTNDGDTLEVAFIGDDTSCDLPVAVGQHHFVFLKRIGDGLFYGQMTQPALFTDRNEMLELFERKYGVVLNEFKRRDFED